jgi:hypothetical protein
MLLILGACLAPAVLALRGLPETAGHDLIGAAPGGLAAPARP